MTRLVPYVLASVRSAFQPQGETGDVFKKELIYPGNFVKKDESGNVEFELPVDESLMDHWVATFDKMRENGVDVPVPVEHTTDPEKRRGTVVRMTKEFNPERGKPSLYAFIKFRDPKTAADMSKTSQVSLFSPPSFSDGKGHEYTRPITHVALTDYPLVPGLDAFEKAVAASLARCPDRAIAMSKVLSMDSGEDQTMSPMQELAQDLGIDVGGETDDAVIKDLIEQALQSEESGEGEDQPIDDQGLSMDDVPADGPGDQSTADLGDAGDQSTGDITTLADLADAMGIDLGGETDDAAIAQMILDAWDADEADEASEIDDAGVDTGDAGYDDTGMQFQPGDQAASLAISASMSSMVARSRRGEIAQLCKERKITPAARDELVKKYADPKQVTYALSHRRGDDYEAVVHALSLNKPQFRTGSRTGAQVPDGSLSSDNVLVKDAERRSKK